MGNSTTKKAKTRSTILFSSPGGVQSNVELDRLVRETIARVADKWTMLVLEVLAEHKTLRFSKLAELIGGVSQKMLTKTLRAMEQDGFLTRTVYAEVPPRVEYRLTQLGYSLGEAFCGVWNWALEHHDELMKLRGRASPAGSARARDRNRE
jgi:DNA-binding HxlR family transcriptional regulator